MAAGQRPIFTLQASLELKSFGSEFPDGQEFVQYCRNVPVRKKAELRRTLYGEGMGRRPDAGSEKHEDYQILISSGHEQISAAFDQAVWPGILGGVQTRL